MEIKITIYVEPVAKGRPRATTRAGRVFIYTPAKTAHAESLIRETLINEGSFGEGIPLRLEATFYRQRPKSLPKRVELPVSRPDLSNYLKTLEDALNKFTFQDDSQIVDLHIRKRFGSPPRIELTITSDNVEVLR